MHWITRRQIGVDRMASAWLITRFIDAHPTFDFVPESTMPAPEAGEAFDMPGVRLSHRHGHSTFHTMLEEYGLTDPVLARIALVVDEADIVQEAPLEAAAFGVDVVCRGIRLIAADDAEAIRHALVVFDGLYAYFQAAGHPNHP